MRKISTQRTKLSVGFKGIVNSKSQAVMNFDYAKSVENFVVKKGVLTAEAGIDAFEGRYPLPSLLRHELPTFESGNAIRNLYVQEHPLNSTYDVRVVARLEDNSLWYCDVFSQNDEWQRVENLNIASDVCAVNYRYDDENLFILSTSSEKMFILKGATPYVYHDAPNFISMAVHNSRVFGAINQKTRQVWYSSHLDPLEWAEDSENSGYIELAEEGGDILKLESFLNYLFIFRENGIYRLTAYGDPSDFVLKKVFCDTGYIYKDTIVQCADKIIFLAEEGLYAFDGYEAVRIGKELPDIFNKHIASAAYLNDVYYLTCNTINGESEPSNDTLICYTVSQNEFCVISGVSVKGLRTIKSYHEQEVGCIFNGDDSHRMGQISKSGKIFGAPTHKVYKSPVNDLGTSKTKLVRDVSILTKYPLTLTVVLDGNRYEYALEGRDTPQSIIVEKCGKMVGFELSSDEENAYVEPFEANIEVSV